MPPTQPSLFRNSFWRDLKEQTHKGSLNELLALLPQFACVPFIMDRYENPYTDLIVRLPLHGNEPTVPIAMVSKSYGLVQHQEAIQAVGEALSDRGIDPSGLSGRLTLSELGERMHLRLVLPQVWDMPGGDHLHVQVHCINSVDRSMALQVRLGWYRLVCTNGLLFTESASLRRVHVTGNWRGDLADMLDTQMQRIVEERSVLQNWLSTKVHMNTFLEWVDEVVTLRWGVQTAARVCHIARTGYDGTPERVQEKTPASKYAVQSDDKPVPGLEPPAHSAFDASQILSWVAEHARDIQTHMVWMGNIHSLIAELIGRAVAQDPSDPGQMAFTDL